jgi:type II secretory pathway predicted ATPase ExeA
MKYAGLEQVGPSLSLSPHLLYYSLQVDPFQQNPDPRFLWLDERRREALSVLKSNVLENKGLLVLTGDVGTGKTILTNALIEALGDDVVIGRVPYPRLDPLDFFRVVASAYKLTDPLASREALLVQLERFLSQAASEGRRALLVIDEAQSLSRELFEELWPLTCGFSVLNVLLVGQPELKTILANGGAGPWPRGAITPTLEPLAADEVGAYIQHRLRAAGSKRDLFSPEAIGGIFALSGGVPRIVNTIGDLALVRGYGDGLQTIDSRTIENCARQLDPDADPIGATAFLRSLVRRPSRPSPGEPDPLSGHEDADRRARPEGSSVPVRQAKPAPRRGESSPEPLRRILRRSEGVPARRDLSDTPARGSRPTLVRLFAVLPGLLVVLGVAGYIVYPAALTERGDISAPIESLASPSRESQPPPEIPRPEAAEAPMSAPPAEAVAAVAAQAGREKALPTATAQAAGSRESPESVAAEALKRPPAAPVPRTVPGGDTTATETRPRGPAAREAPVAQPTREAPVAQPAGEAPVAQPAREAAVAEPAPRPPAPRANTARESAESPDPSRIIDWLLKEYLPQKD